MRYFCVPLLLAALANFGDKPQTSTQAASPSEADSDGSASQIIDPDRQLVFKVRGLT